MRNRQSIRRGWDYEPPQFPKKAAQFIHARRRAKERFGLDLTPALTAEVVWKIQDQKAKFVGRQSNRLTMWDVWVEGRVIRVIYDSKRKSLVTVLKRHPIQSSSPAEAEGVQP